MVSYANIFRVVQNCVQHDINSFSRFGGFILKTALIIVLLVISIVLAILIMMQEGKDNGLTSALTGSVDSYWSQNKGKSKKARLNKATALLGCLFMVLALLVSSKFIK